MADVLTYTVITTDPGTGRPITRVVNAAGPKAVMVSFLESRPTDWPMQPLVILPGDHLVVERRPGRLAWFDVPSEAGPDDAVPTISLTDAVPTPESAARRTRRVVTGEAPTPATPPSRPDARTPAERFEGVAAGALDVVTMRGIRREGETVTPTRPLPVLKAKAGAGTHYLGIGIPKTRVEEAVEVINDAVLVALAGRLDLCTLHDGSMGKAVWRRALFRAVIEHEAGQLLPPPLTPAQRAHAGGSDAGTA